MTSISETCPLCRGNRVQLYHEDKKRLYFQCDICSLVFVPSLYLLSSEQEKAEYDLHENNIYDEGYRRFLYRLSDPLLKKLKPGQRGLDFGCGPEPALAAILGEGGHVVD